MILSPCLILKNAKFLMTGICFMRIAWAEFHHHPAPSLYCLYFSGDHIKSKSALLSGFPCGSACKESAHNVGDLGLIPGLGRSPGEGKGYPLQYSGLDNSRDYTVYGVTKSQTWLSHFHFQGPVLITQSFCVAEVLLQWKRTKKASDIDIRRGTGSAPKHYPFNLHLSDVYVRSFLCPFSL